MSLSAVYQALQGSISGGSIDLYAAAQKPALAPLAGVLGLLRISSAWTLTGAMLAQPSGSVVLTGNGSYGIPGAAAANVAAVAVRLTATAPNGDDVFSLALSITTPGWTFPSMFPTLPPSQQYTGNGVVLQPSFFAEPPMPLQRPVLVGLSQPLLLRLQGDLPMVGPLAPFIGLLGAGPLRLDGTVGIPATPGDPPDLDLVAVASGTALSASFIATLELKELGLQLATNTEIDPEEWGVSAISVMNLNASLYLGAPPVVAHLFTPVLAASSTWRLLVGFDAGALPLTQGLALVASFFGIPVSALPLPTGFDDFTGFYFSMIEVSIPSPLGGHGAVNGSDGGYLAMTLGSSKVWQPPVPFVTFQDVGTRWVVAFVPLQGTSVPTISGNVYGSIVVGGAPWQPSAARALPGQVLFPAELAAPSRALQRQALADGNAFHIDVNALVPQWTVSGQLRDSEEIPIGAMLSYYFGGGVPPGTPAGMAVTAFAFEAAPLDQSYSANADITMDWSVPLGGNVELHLTGLSFYVRAMSGSVSGGISAALALAGGAPPGWPDPVFQVSADYLPGGAGESGWRFAGELYPDTALELVALVSNFLGITPPASLPTLSLEQLALSFQTVDQTYAIAGTVVGRWNPTLFGTQLVISAQAGASIAKTTKDGAASGKLLGRFAVNKIALEVGMDVGVDEPTYQLRVELGELWLAAVTSWTGTAPSRHQVVTVQLGGMTLGGILEYLVNLAAPTIGYHLEAPWNLLDRVELSRFQLRIDPTNNLVDFTYQVSVNLGVMSVDRIGVRYQKIDGVPSVSLALTGNFLGQSYSDEKPLAWDVVNDPPPAVPGQGTSLVELYYLGLGQHVTLSDIASLQTVRATLDRLMADMREVTDPNQSPLKQPGGAKMKFAADSEWLIGLDIWLMETVRLGLIFNDPRLYGLSIELGGESAGSLAGLKFEILYKKITDDIGMFRVELRLPEAFRHLEFGEVSITLGVIVVEIYTNGNFLIDLGFPYDRNFDRSFTVQVFPFLGRGGIYFGVLNGSTSKRVPRITNGTFSPVLELGIGLAVGVGKDISIGPLSGGIYVQLEVIFQGVLAWFHPSAASDRTSMYYWVQGIAALHGKLYGAVDFKVIKVSVTLDAYAQVSVVFESYRPALFRLDVAVSVKASIKILFIRIHFSFGVHLNVSFTVGSEQPTPWILAGGSGGGGGSQLLAAPSSSAAMGSGLWRARRRPELQRRALLAQHLRQRRRLGLKASIPRGERTSAVTSAFSDEAYLLHWDASVKVFPDAPRTVPLTMLPSFSVDQLPIVWNGATPPLRNPAYRAAFLLFAPNGKDDGDSDDVKGARSATRSAHAETTQELSSDLLIEAFLRWAISAVAPGATSVTAGQLDLLGAQITWPQTRDLGFSLANLATFFTTNLALQIAGDPGGDPASVGGMAFPIPPYLSWSSPQAGARDFATFNKVGALYEWGVASYVGSFDPIAPPPSPPPPDDPSAYESFAAYAFRDYCLMLARGALQPASDAMNGWPYTVTGAPSLTDIAVSFPRTTIEYSVRAGDSVDSVAAAVGATPAELVDLNPSLPQTLATASAGQQIELVLGIAPEIVATDNPDAPLAASTPTLRGVPVQAQLGDTLNGIAARFALPSTSALFTAGLADDRQLLQPGATFAAPATTYTPPVAMTAVAVAATMFVRYSGDASATSSIPDEDWYAQTIFDLNQATLASGLTWNDPLPAGQTIYLPGALHNPSPAQQQSYTVLAGDTIARVASAQSLWQNYATGSGPVAGWPAFRDAVTPAGAAFSIPATTVPISLGESVNMLASRTLIFAGDVDGLLGWIGGAAVLAPLAVLVIPSLQATIAAGDTFAKLSERYGLSVSELAAQLAKVSPIFPEQTALTIAHLPVQQIDALVARVLAGDGPSQISGMTSRQLYSGLDLPAPVDQDGHQAATGALTAFYDLSGQQLVGPTPDATQPDAVALQVTFTVDSGASWISLVGSTTVDEETQLSDALLRHNRALAGGGLVVGQVVVTGAVDELPFSYTNAQLASLYPQSGLAVAPSAGPSPLPNAGRTPRTYGLDHHVELQASSPLPIPSSGGALTGNPSLWPFPRSLLALAQAASATPYELIAAPADGKTEPYTLTSATFATALPFAVRRLDESVGAGDGVVSLLGADTSDRQLLLGLWRYLADPDTPPGTQAYLAVSPSPNAGNASGLAVLALDAAKTYLIKTNLSTETRSGEGAVRARYRGRDVTPDPYAAPFSRLADFLLLLWEGSVVGGTGYWLGVSTVGGGGVPASAFDSDGKAELVLVVLAGEQQAAVSIGRPLLPFNNCAAVAPGFDASTTLFAEAADDSDLMVQPLLPPGNAGFTLTLPKPPPPETSAQAALQQMFSLLTYALAPQGGSPFTASLAGMPIGPDSDESGGQEAFARVRRRRRVAAGLQAPTVDEATTWRYQRVVPVARFGPPSVTPAVLGLPAPAQDPYRGLAGQASVPTADFALGFADVLGNVTAPPSSTVQVSANAGYTDALIGVATWPAVTSWFSVVPAPDGLGGVELIITVSPQPSVGAPTPSQSPVAALAALGKQAERYAQIYYQVMQPDLSAAVLTSLSQQSDGAPLVLPAPLAPLRRFATAALLQSQAMASSLPLVPDLSLAPTLGQVAQSYGVGFAELAAANADAPIVELFGAVALTVPAYVVFPDGASADSMVAGLASGWPTPTGSALLAMPENAGDLPLRTGTVLAIPSRAVPILGEPTPSLNDLAAAAFTQAGLLAADNPGVALTPGFVFTVEGVAVTVAPGGATTFSAVQSAFAALGVNVTIADLATDNADSPGIFPASAAVVTLHYLAQPGDTLAANHSGKSVSELAAGNAATVNLFDSGALVFLGDFSPAPQIESGELHTLGELAARYGCPPAQLLAANPSAALPPTNAWVIPGGLSLPPAASGAPIYAAMQVRDGDTLDGLAPLFAPAPGADSAATNLAAANLALPDTLTPGQSITVVVGGTPYQTTTVAGDSFASVLARLGAAVTLPDLIAVIGGEAGVLQTGALLVTPPALLPATNLAPAGVLARYGVEAGAFGAANTALAGLIASGVTLRGPDGLVSVTTAARDTLNAIVARFAAAGAQLTVAQILDANPGAALFAAGALALLPAVPARIPCALPAGAGPFASPIFPLTAALRLQRDDELVDPQFRVAGGGGATARADSTVPAPARTTGPAGAESETFDQFAASFEAALPTLRLGTGKTETAQADLWVVDFGAGGIAQLQVGPSVQAPAGQGLWPRYFALRPLYTDLVSRTVTLPVVRPDGTLRDADSPTSLQGIDVELWARRMLADVDRFLGVPYAPGAHEVSAAALDGVLAAKQSLMQSIPGGLAPILQIPDPEAASGQVAAAKALAQQLGIQLSRAYATAAIVQYAATVRSPWTEGSALSPARVVGQPTQLAPDGAPAGGPRAQPTPPADAARTFSLGGAKTALDQASSWVSVLLSVADPAHQANLELDLDYAITEVEFNITPVEGTEGYEASDWLSLLPPITSADHPASVSALLGKATVPIPLRTYPALPTLLGQTAQPSFPGGAAPTLEQAKLWTFGLTYSHEHAPQDEVIVTARYNVAPPPPSARLTAQTDVATALARYIAAADKLWAILAGFADGSGAPAVLANASASLATLAADVAAAWAGHWNGGQEEAEAIAAGALAEVRYGLVATLAKSKTLPEVLTSLTLTAQQASPGPTGQWPAARVRLPGGDQVTLIPGTPVDGSLVYQFPEEPRLLAGQWPEITLEWADLDAAAYQNARAQVQVRRNHELIPHVETTEGFVYRTPTIDAPDVVTPLNAWTDPIALPGATVAAALQAAFTTLFGAAQGAPITIGMFYGYALVPAPLLPSGGLITYLPVALFPDHPLSTTTADQIAAALEVWWAANQPAVANGSWVFSLTTYSQIDPSNRRPLLSFDRLVYAITAAP